MKTVYFIYAEGCKSCNLMRSIIQRYQFAGEDKIKQFDLFEMECEDENAVDYAVENGISDLPACKVGEGIVEGDQFDVEKLKKLLEAYNEE